MGLLPLLQLAEQHEVVALVRPGRPRTRLRHWLAPLVRRLRQRTVDPVAQFARARGIPSLMARSGSDPLLVARLTALRPDVLCISTFSWLLAPALFRLPAYGTINLHPSLLPRHRGAAPLFWVYYHDDRQTGVTVHVVNERADAGAILLQEAFRLPRGYNIVQLHSETAQRGAKLLLQAVEAIATGRSTRTPQDEKHATPAPRVRRGQKMVDFTTWDVERVWHFLAGLYPQFIEPLADRQGRAVVYRQVVGYEVGQHRYAPGELDSTPYGWKLYCLKGFVKLAHTPCEPRTTGCFTS